MEFKLVITRHEIIKQKNPFFLNLEYGRKWKIYKKFLNFGNILLGDFKFTLTFIYNYNIKS